MSFSGVWDGGSLITGQFRVFYWVFMYIEFLFQSHVKVKVTFYYNTHGDQMFFDVFHMLCMWQTGCDHSALTLCPVGLNQCSALSCEYRCHPSPQGGACYCPDGFTVANDSRTCVGQCMRPLYYLITDNISI